MKPDQINIDDIQRILIGNVPGSFYIEVIIRLVIIYALLITSMRLMGKRMSSQLSRNELAAIVVLAAAIGMPIQTPDKGIIPAFIISLIVVFTERGISALSFHNEWFEQYSQGKYTTLITDGVTDPAAMKKSRISKDRLFGQVRTHGLTHLGKVRYLYWEASGNFTLIEQQKQQPGLSVIPAFDADFINEQQKVENVVVCMNCGADKKDSTNNVCNNCHHNEWTQAIC